jgi:uncharacterized membrane protein YbhN (UPF0104 family)
VTCETPRGPVTRSPKPALNPRRLITFVASLAVTAFFLALALNSVDLPKLARSFASADYRLVGLAALFTFAGYVLRTKRC